MSQYPHVEWFARETGIPASNLIRGFELERDFHATILAEPDANRRQQLYAQIYSQVHPLYRVSRDVEQRIRSKQLNVKRFQEALRGKSILDVGWGDGAFLQAVDRELPHGQLLGIDVDIGSAIPSPIIEYRSTSVVEFHLEVEFDVVFSDNVTEHIAPADLPVHLASIHRALKPGGTFILIMPHRFFGPSDVTRIIDNTYSNRVPAMGSHLNESTYREMRAALQRSGFVNLRPHRLVKVLGRRTNLAAYCWAEQNAWLLNLLRRVRPRFAYTLVLIAQKEPRTGSCKNPVGTFLFCMWQSGGRKACQS